MIRRIGALVLALAAIVVWFTMAPEDVETPTVQTQEQVRDRSSEISGALADYELNEARTAGAPQQAVVNGWVAKDLLTIIAEQQNEALTRPEVPAPLPPVVPDDERIPALIGLVVLSLALVASTSPRSVSVGGPSRRGAQRADEAVDEGATSSGAISWRSA